MVMNRIFLKTFARYLVLNGRKYTIFRWLDEQTVLILCKKGYASCLVQCSNLSVGQTEQYCSGDGQCLQINLCGTVLPHGIEGFAQGIRYQFPPV